MEYEGKDKPASVTGGVKPFGIEGRFHSERERLAGGFTDADRAWRKRFLHEQVLHHNEPIVPDWFYKERYNPIRRFYRWPLETLFKTLEPTLKEWTVPCRWWTGKTLLGLATIYTGWYIIKYHSNDWSNTSGWYWITSKPFAPMGSPEYGKTKKMADADYYDNRMGFKECPVKK